MLQWHVKLKMLCIGIFMKTEGCVCVCVSVCGLPYMQGYCTFR